MDHEQYMRMALQEARKAMENDEVPVGAVIVSKRPETASNVLKWHKISCSE